MCRLYGLRSTHPTKVGCELIDAQNSLIRQSLKDERGLSNPHGWGVGFWRDGEISCKRQVGPASESEEFRNTAIEIEAPTLLAHVRRATVGSAKHVNTHPFLSDEAMLAHNGHIDHFDRVRPKLIDAMGEEYSSAIHGDTDSEHFFQFLRSLRAEKPDVEMREVVLEGILQVEEWAREIDPDAEVALNVLWVEGPNLAGARSGRSLWYLEREEPHRCEVCGRMHAEPDPDDPYYVVELASERITSERWTEVPDRCVFDVGPDRDFDTTSLD